MRIFNDSLVHIFNLITVFFALFIYNQNQAID